MPLSRLSSTTIAVVIGLFGIHCVAAEQINTPADCPIVLVCIPPATRPATHVGEPIIFKLSLKNASDRPISLPIGGEKINSCFSTSAYIRGFPGFHEYDGTISSSIIRSGGSANFRDFVTLPAGGDTKQIDVAVVPIVAGELEVVIFAEFAASYLTNNADGNMDSALYPNAWGGNIIVNAGKYSISADPPNEVVKRWDDLRHGFGDPKQAAKDLDILGSDNDYFVAHYLLLAYRQAKSPAVRDAALQRLIPLVKFGTGYEAFGDLLSILKDDHAARDLRRQVLTCFPCMYLGRHTPGISISDQAYYLLSSAELVDAIATIKILARGSDPLLAIDARKLLTDENIPLD